MPLEFTQKTLQELIKTDVWQDCFAALSESLGFSLSIYSHDGKMLHSPNHAVPYCQRLHSSASFLVDSCTTHCRPFMENALNAGRSDVFKCYLEVLSFVVPLRHENEHAVILGQGSFSSTEDFYASRIKMEAAGLDVTSLAAPAAFTSYQKARMACDFTADAVRRLLRNRQEDRTLGTAFASLKDHIGRWSMPTAEHPETLYRHLLQELSSLTAADGSAVFVRDKKDRRYLSLVGRPGNGHRSDAVSLCENGAIVQGLLAGKPFVLSDDPAATDGAEPFKSAGILHFFPIIVHGQLDGILCIADRYFQTSDMHIITTLCRQTALSIENSVLRQELFQKFDRYIALADMTKAMVPIRNNDRMLLRMILDESANLLKAEQGSLMVIDQETDDLLLSEKKGAVDGVADQFRIRHGEGIAGRVAVCGEALLVEDLERDQRVGQKNRSHYKTRSFVSIPLKIGERIIGVLNLSDKTTGEVFNEDDLKLVQAFATHAAIVMDRNASLHKNEELEKLTITDHLTGLANRRHLFARLQEELTRSERRGHKLSLLMLDLDSFKRCNDTRGHPFGDRVLKSIAGTILNAIRSIDIASRYGGDEFIIILPETDVSLAREIAERIRGNVEGRLEGSMSDGSLQDQEAVTVSIGIACYPDHGITIERLLKNVDTAMYDAKNGGKNRIAVFGNTP